MDTAPYLLKDLLKELVSREDEPWAAFWQKDIDNGTIQPPRRETGETPEAVRDRLKGNPGAGPTRRKRLTSQGL